MRSFIASALLLGAVSNAQTMFSATASGNATSSECAAPGGVHIVVARASLEAPGYGIIGVVKDSILSSVPGSTAEFVDYPATLNDYINSETTGVVAMRKLITSYAANCPCGPIVVMGYSQGAQVSADSLVGQNVNGFPDNTTVDTPLSTSILARTAAVILMGDPSLQVNSTFHVGNSTKNSIFPRHDNQNFDIAGLGSRTQSYCDDGDPYCAAGGNLIVHLEYVGEYGAQAASFAVNNINSYNAQHTCNGTSGVAPTGTAPSTHKPTASGTAPVSRGPSATGTAVSVKPTGTGYAGATGTGSAKPTTSAKPSGYSNGAESKVSSAMGAVSMAFISGVLTFML